MREQDQIYGRTCRNGEFGSVQLVLLVPEAAKEDRYLKPFLVLQLLMQGRRLSCDGFLEPELAKALTARSIEWGYKAFHGPYCSTLFSDHSVLCGLYTYQSTAQGGGGSFKDRKPI